MSEAISLTATSEHPHSVHRSHTNAYVGGCRSPTWVAYTNGGNEFQCISLKCNDAYFLVIHSANSIYMYMQKCTCTSTSICLKTNVSLKWYSHSFTSSVYWFVIFFSLTESPDRLGSVFNAEYNVSPARNRNPSQTQTEATNGVKEEEIVSVVDAPLQSTEPVM